MINCFICNSGMILNLKTNYNCCISCGHQTLNSSIQTYMVNDVHEINEIKKTTNLDKFKSAVLDKYEFNTKEKILLDIGSASGRFLFKNLTRYKQAIGIEVTPESIEFSQCVLKLNIVQSIAEVNIPVNTVTAWHSLEHIPSHQLEDLLTSIVKKLAKEARFYVSIPNSNSRQCEFFKTKWAFYDPPNHVHQFTPDSIELLMARYGFKVECYIESKPYNIFGWIQGILNMIIPFKNYLYCRLKRKNIKKTYLLDILNIILLSFAVPVGKILELLDKNNIKKQGVITICFQVVN